MQFSRPLREGIRNGEITSTIRIWTKPHVKVGGRYPLPPGEVEVESIQPMTLGDITPELARRSGFKGVVDLLKTAKHGKGENVYFIIFRYQEPFSKKEVMQSNMESNEEVFDNPTGWVGDHVRKYVESDGQEGHHWRGMTTLLLTTRGRKSGKLRRTALIYGQAENSYLIVASNGGADNHPLWYLNLAETPAVEIQVGADKIAGRARTANPEEKARLWPVMSKIFPTYDAYQKKTSEVGRDIPLVIIEPI